MSPDLYNVIKQICEEKQISEESVVATVELALAAAYRKDFADKLQNIHVELEPQTGVFKVFDMKKVVEDVSPELKEEALKLARQKKKAALYMPGVDMADEDREEAVDIDLNDDAKLIEEGKVLLKFNPRTQITISDANEKDSKLALGDEYKEELSVPADFGRMAAQTAKQVIIQRIREAERELIFNTYKNQEGEMLTGVVQRIEGSVVLIDIGKANALLPYREQIPKENYRIGQRLKVILTSVDMTTKGPEIIVSRATKDLVKKLFELEVPEMETGTVEIKALAREPGSRSKIAVVAHEENIDPIGSCVGQRGARVTAVIDELQGEKIDIIQWNKDDEKFIAAALSPAKIDKVEIIDAEDRRARVTVKPDQQSLAIGKGGQNVRLAAKLTGWKIDIAQSLSGEIVEASDDVATEEVKEETVDGDGAKKIVENDEAKEVLEEIDGAEEVKENSTD